MSNNTPKIQSIIDIIQLLPTNKHCHQYIAQQRWQDGVINCPYETCNSESVYVFTDGIRYKCKQCKHIFKATTRTFMEGSKLPLIKWILAMHLITHSAGISSVQLSKDLHVTQGTAWFMMHRLREALALESKQEKLDGIIEIDETFVGGKNKNRHLRKKQKYTADTGRNWQDKTPVFGMKQRNGRLVANVLDHRRFADVGLEIVRNVEIGATLMTDDWKGYDKIEYLYTRKSIDHSKGIYVDGDITTNRIENCWAHFKRALHGSYIQVSPKHLNKYVQEYVFKHNNRNLGLQARIDTIIKYSTVRLKYKDLIAHNA